MLKLVVFPLNHPLNNFGSNFLSLKFREENDLLPKLVVLPLNQLLKCLVDGVEVEKTGIECVVEVFIKVYIIYIYIYLFKFNFL